MKGVKYSFIIILIIGGLVFIVNQAFLYSSTTTHPYLTEEIVKFYNYYYDPDITVEQLERMKKGSTDEDFGTRSWFYHFYDPVYNQGLPMLSKQWAQSPEAQSGELGGDHTWQTSIADYNAGYKNKAFYSLGHVLHLIEDMAVPSHTRGDAHQKGDPFEEWAGNLPESSDLYNIANLLIQQGIKPRIFNDLDLYFDKMANFSNRNFFSNDSIDDTIDEYGRIKLDARYSEPVIVREIFNTRYIGYAYGKIIDSSRLVPLLKVEKNDRGDKIYTLNHTTPKIHEEYFRILGREAVINGAGVVKLFFDSITEPEQELVEQEKKLSWFQKVGNKIKGFGQFVYSAVDGLLHYPAPALESIVEESIPESEYMGTLGTMIPEVVEEIVEPVESPEVEIIEEPIEIIKEEEIEEVQPPEVYEAKPRKDTFLVTRVIDGDTIVLENEKRVRYIGINSLELPKGCFAQEALEKNKELVEGKRVRLEKDVSEMDNYGRLLRYVYIDEVFVNDYLVRQGYAYDWAYGPDTKYADQLVEAENYAKKERLGLWGACYPEDAEFEIEGEVFKASVFHYRVPGPYRIIEQASAIEIEPEEPLEEEEEEEPEEEEEEEQTGPTSIIQNITEDSTWTLGGSPYIIYDNASSSNELLEIAESVTLTIEAGVTVKFVNPGFKVFGTIKAQGTSDNPIVFTSNSSSAQAGNWSGIWFTESSTNSVLNHVAIRYAGSRIRPFRSGGTYSPAAVGAAIRVENTSITLRNSTIEHNLFKGVWLDNSPDTIIQNSTFQNHLEYDTNSQWLDDYFRNFAIYVDSSNPEIRNSTFQNNITGIYVTNSSEPEIKNNQLSNNNNYPIWVQNSYPEFSNNQMDGNSWNGIVLRDIELDRDYTLSADVPFINYDYPFNSIIVPENRTLTVEPGIIIKSVYSTSGLNIEGTLIAEGTNGKKIVFTSFYDDEYGGDTNGDGDETQANARAGMWGQIVFASTSIDSSLEHVIVRYGGRKWMPAPIDQREDYVLDVDNSDISLNDSTIGDNTSGIRLVSSNSTIDSSTLLNNETGIYIDVASVPTLLNLVFTNNIQAIEDLRPEEEEEEEEGCDCVEIIDIFYDGQGSKEPDEYVEIKNNSDETVDLEYWTLSDEADHTYMFPFHNFEPDEIIKVYTNMGTYSFESKTAIWNNSGDTAYLKNRPGELIDSYGY